jgi:hypothetical protein
MDLAVRQLGYSAQIACSIVSLDDLAPANGLGLGPDDSSAAHVVGRVAGFAIPAVEVLSLFVSQFAPRRLPPLSDKVQIRGPVAQAMLSHSDTDCLKVLGVVASVSITVFVGILGAVARVANRAAGAALTLTATIGASLRQRKAIKWFVLFASGAPFHARRWVEFHPWFEGPAVFGGPPSPRGGLVCNVAGTALGTPPGTLVTSLGECFYRKRLTAAFASLHGHYYIRYIAGRTIATGIQPWQ